jgi:hypothetical protein
MKPDKREIIKLEKQLEAMEVEYKKSIAPIQARLSELRQQQLDAIAAKLGVHRGQRRRFSSELESELRQPHRQPMESQIDRWRNGFEVENYHYRGIDFVVSIVTIGDNAGIGGIPVSVVMACELIAT